MTVEQKEKEFIRNNLPKPYAGCQILQAEKDRKLRAALLADLGLIYSNVEITVIVDRAMRVIKGMR